MTANVSRLRPGPRFTVSRVDLPWTRSRASAVLVAHLRAGYELTDMEAGRLVSGRSVEEWQALKAQRRQGFTGKANVMLMRISGKIAIYDALEYRGEAWLRVWRYVGLAADLEYARSVNVMVDAAALL